MSTYIDEDKSHAFHRYFQSANDSRENIQLLVDYVTALEGAINALHARVKTLEKDL